MSTRLSKIGSWLTHPSGLAGAFLGASVVAMQPDGVGLHGVLFGWAYGMVVGAMIRMFRVPAGAYPLIGLLAGPLPFAIFLTREASPDSRAAVFVGFLLGLVLGLVEWARAVHERKQERPPT